MTTRSILPLCLLALLPLTLARSTTDRTEGAFVLFSRTLSGPLVESLNTTVTYTVHNVGSAPALRVALRDNAFPASRFVAPKGVFRHVWAAVKPGETETLDVDVRPKRNGELFVSAPSVSYRDAGESRTSRLAAAESVVIEDHVAFRRRTDSHAREWGVYAAAFVALVAAPYAVSVVRTPGRPVVAVTKKQ